VHNGATWQATRDTGREPPHGDWILLAAAGADGADGRSFVVRGTWNEVERYQRHDVAMRDGSSFVALVDEPGPCPGAGWQLWAGRGKTGKPGDRGPKGDKGEPGQDAPSVVGFYDENGQKVLTFADGTEMRA
jgi:hypothetical protein